MQSSGYFVLAHAGTGKDVPNGTAGRFQLNRFYKVIIISVCMCAPLSAHTLGKQVPSACVLVRGSVFSSDCTASAMSLSLKWSVVCNRHEQSFDPVTQCCHLRSSRLRTAQRSDQRPVPLIMYYICNVLSKFCLGRHSQLSSPTEDSPSAPGWP